VETHVPGKVRVSISERMRQVHILDNFIHRTVDVVGVRTEVYELGSGPTLLLLHSEEGLIRRSFELAKLANVGRLIIPSHPGFGGSALPPSISSVEDLSYFYLDFLTALNLKEVVLIGASFGGWIAAELAVKCTHRLSHLILLDPLGIKIGNRESRDIADMHAIEYFEFVRLAYADNSKCLDFQEIVEEEALVYAMDREAFTYFGWCPYMHNPKLKGRLNRINVPTLIIWGEQDRIVSPDYGRAFSSEISGAEFRLIAECGHYPLVECADVVASNVSQFIGSNK
jgi:pimeloyl-ACP methyl ester carboxylesterase